MWPIMSLIYHKQLLVRKQWEKILPTTAPKTCKISRNKQKYIYDLYEETYKN